MRFLKLTVLCLAFVLLCNVYANRNRRAQGTIADTTAECVFMKQRCDYAMDLQNDYNAMRDGDEEERAAKRELLQALNSAIAGCEQARRQCTRSVRKRK